ncbi:hypothetical protein INT43_006616 [Umbelopsis isabellina]|uniref:Aminoglycoside phosphotransferase domain-containing protein n=1 Tax=Mortierella isabellina TaxID=91625 RepID=A0A8H7UKY3_MORIS|nr:hypothetical protein INT43_006616 [Umbelopsis isabellina]
MSSKSSNQASQGTSEVREGHQIDVQTLETYLSEKIPGFKAPLAVSQFKFGQSNPTYLLADANKQQYVLRKKPPGALLSATAHAVEREFRVLNALGTSSDVPVPKVYVLCEDVSIIGTPFYVMEFVKGRIFTDVRMLSLPFEERKQCWYSAIRTLAKLHKVDYVSAGLKTYGRNGGFYSRQIKSLQKVSAAQAAVVDEESGKPVGNLPRLQEMLAWFARNQVSDRSTIVHGDYKIFHPSEPRVIGILDWELSTIGHPLSDLANLLQPFYLPGDGDDANPGFRSVKVEDLPIPPAERLMQIYCEESGISYPIQNWSFCVAFAFFRVAVITQGIAARVARKQASSPQAKWYAARFVPFTHLALEIVDQGELDHVSEDKSKL